MRYIAFAYNLYTLAHIISYTNDIWGRDNVDIVYSDIATPIPNQILEDYSICYIPANGVLKKRRFSSIICSCRLSLRIWKSIDTLISNTDEDIVLVVFRDNEVEEATFIEKAFKKYGARIHLYMMEEGVSIYANEKPAIRYLLIKRLFYVFFGVSKYPLMACPQGINPFIEKIICLNPDLLKNKVNKRVVLDNIRYVFSDQINEYLINSVCENEPHKKEYKFLFLTQPFDMFRADFEELEERYNKLLPEVFRILSSKGKVIIKLHPREHYDYTRYKCRNIDVSSNQEMILPVQCLMAYYGNPQVISMWSSGNLGIKNEIPSIYLFRLFQIPGVESFFSKDFFVDNNIINCGSLDELSKAIL